MILGDFLDDLRHNFRKIAASDLGELTGIGLINMKGAGKPPITLCPQVSRKSESNSEEANGEND